jgi:hypothetical protein
VIPDKEDTHQLGFAYGRLPPNGRLRQRQRLRSTLGGFGSAQPQPRVYLFRGITLVQFLEFGVWSLEFGNNTLTLVPHVPSHFN